MISLTDEEKLKYVKKARRRLEDGKNTMICFALYEAIYQGWAVPPKVLQHFPEIVKRKPESTPEKWQWFPTGDTESRVNLLSEVIEELETKIANGTIKKGKD